MPQLPRVLPSFSTDPLILQITEFSPDQPALNNPGSANIIGSIPRTQQSYGPFPAPVVYSGALTARCQGAYSGIDSAGNVNIFAGDINDLYRLTTASSTPSKVSKTLGVYNAPADGMWTFCFMNGRVIATQINDNVQSFLIDSGSAFADLSAGAPKARYCAVIKNFLFLGNTTDSINGAQPQRCWWSALNDPTNFPTPGTASAAQNQSDYQDVFGNHGWLQGLVGNLGTSHGAAFFEHAVWRINYVGPPEVFEFQPAQGVTGTPAPASIVHVGSNAFYFAEDGFKMFDGTTSTPIGLGKVDKWFLSNVDQSNLFRIVGSVDTLNKLIVWAVPLIGNINGTPTDLLVYNYDLNRWGRIQQTCETIVRTLSFGYTLDTLDNTGYNLDTLPFSLDSRVWTGGNILFSMFDTNHKLNYFNGSNVAATIDTTEINPYPGFRARVTNSRPLVDGGSPTVAIGVRDRQIDASTLGTAIPINSSGTCPQNTSGRYIYSEIVIPAGSTWTHCMGVEITAAPSGTR